MNIAKGFYEWLSRVWLWQRRQRLRSKLFIVFFLATILPVSFLVLYSYETSKDQLINQAVDSVGSTIDQINNNIENKLDMYAQVATMIYLDIELRNYMVNEYRTSDFTRLDAHAYINNLLYKLLAMNPNLKSITLYTENKSLYTDGFFVKYMEDLPQAAQQQAQQANGNITLFYLNDESAQEKSVLLTRSLNYHSLNYPYGILTMEISEQEIYALIEKENQNKTIFVADASGNIITSGLRDSSIIQLSDLDAYNNKETMLMQKSLSNGWVTAVLLPYEELLSQAKHASQKMLYISFACILFAIVMIYTMSTFMTKRIEVLLQHIRKVERGSFNLPTPPMGYDEIGQLSYALNKMAMTIEELIQDVSRKEISRNESEMTSLQAQITPHFLYNSLASISALAVQSNDMQVHRMANDLARFYRISLSKGKKCITIEQEIKLTEHYLSIQRTRYQGLFKVHYALDEALFPYTTLKLIIQPFIENCIHHAIWDDEHGINMIIKLEADGDDVLFSVIDDGMGIPRDKCEQLLSDHDQQHGYGIFNVNKRIMLAYGERYGVTIYSGLGIGTTVRIRIPRTSVFL